MARTFITRTRESVEVAHVTCDVCGAKSRYMEECLAPSSPGVETTAEVTVEMTETTSFLTPGGERKVTAVDLCPACFTGKLLPWLKEQGAEPTTKESGW